MRYFVTIFFIVLGSGFGTFYLVRQGWYPVAIINSEIIWGYNLDKEARVAEYYYQQSLTTSEKEGLKNNNNKQVRVAVLKNIIERKLVSDALRQKLNNIELTASINNIISPYLENPNLEQAAVALYDLNLADFYKLIVIPQAEKELLLKQLQEEGVSYSDWLSQAEKSAKIILLTKDF